jgi:hypothetical protein
MPVTDATDAHYDRNLADWRLISRMLTGDNAATVLKRGAFEARRAFRMRKEREDWKRYTADLIGRLVGELVSSAEQISRDTEASEEYLSSVGAEQESWEVLTIDLAEVLLAYDECWAILDPAQGLHIVPPQQVPRTTESAVVMKGTRAESADGTVFSDQAAQDAWTIYYADHFEVYVETEKNESGQEKLVDEGEYAEGFAFRREGEPAPPAVHISLPWRVSFGLSVARAHRALYRMKSKMDEALTNSLGGLLQIATGGDDTLKTQIEKALKDGAIAVPYDSDHGTHEPVNVGVEGLPHGAEALERKRKEMYRTAYQSLEQASTQMSATEAESRHQGGPAAAMNVLAETMQSAEESILPIVAQAEDFRNAGRELEPSVDWPTDIGDNDDANERLAKAIFGRQRLPADVDTATDVVMGMYAEAGHDPDRDQIEEEVRSRMDRAAQAPTDDTIL